MIQEQKDKWVKALRSGEYRQCQRQLRESTADGYGYCCLGVFCELNGYTIDDTGLLALNGTFGYTDLKALIGNNIVNELITLNDTENKTFSEIAGWIETNISVV